MRLAAKLTGWKIDVLGGSSQNVAEEGQNEAETQNDTEGEQGIENVEAAE